MQSTPDIVMHWKAALSRIRVEIHQLCPGRWYWVVTVDEHINADGVALTRQEAFEAAAAHWDQFLDDI